MTSSRRSRMIVANAPVAVMFSCRAQKIWANDLARARRQHAARRKADRRRAKRVPETRTSRAARADTASAAIESPGSRTSSPATAPASRGCACAISRATLPQIDVAQEQRDQGGSERQHDDRPNVRTHGGNALDYNAQSAADTGSRYILLLSSRPGPCKITSFRRPLRNYVARSPTPVIETTLDRRRPDRQGKVRDIYDFGDRLLIVATDRISAFDYVLGSGIPDKGKVLTQISCFWFDRMRAIVPNHIVSTDPAAFPAERVPHADMLAGRSMLVTHHRAAADRMRRARVPVGLGLEGLSGDRRRVRHPAAGRAARIRSPAAADLHAGHQGAERPRHQHQRAEAATLVGHALLDTRQGRSPCGSTPKAPRTPNRAASSSPTRNSSSASCPTTASGKPRPHHPDRRSADARFVPLLAAGRLQARRRAAQLRQAVRSRLPRTRSSGTSSRPFRRCQTTSSRKRGTNMSRRSAA